MSKGYGLVLTLLVLAAALFGAWYSTTRVSYFPQHLTHKTLKCEFAEEKLEILTDFHVEWFSQTLRSLNEKSISQEKLPNSQKNQIRFFLQPSFHNSLTVRVIHQDHGPAKLIAKKAPVRFDGRPGSNQIERFLTAEEEQGLEEVLTTTNLLSQPVGECHGGLDGNHWIIESRREDGSYRIVHRRSPLDGPVYDVGLYMLSLTGWDFAAYHLSENAALP